MPLIARTFIAALLFATSTLATAEQDWVERSNANAEPLLQVMAKYAPETAAALGVEGFDAEVFDLKPQNDLRFEADAARVASDLESRLAAEPDARVRQDMQILIDTARDQKATSELNRRLMLPYFDLTQALFQGFNALLDPRVSKDRHPAALVRLRKYTGREPGYEPITKLAQARTAERFETAGLTGPWTVEVEQALQNQPRFVAGIRDLFKKSGLTGWEKDLKVLESQLDAHAKWLRTELLPRARTTNRLPAEIYADNLKNFGVKADPRMLIDQATLSFVQTREEMQTLANLVAKERGFASSDYRDVLAALRKEVIAEDALLPTYKARLASLEEIVRREDIVSLPERPAVIRLGTPAESAAQPAPHLRPPRLIGNTGESAEFVLPLENPNAPPGTKMDDFTHDSMAWTLTAHEARPGHELQFASMIESGVSIPRAVFAFNSANVEGWALYAEALVKQHLPLNAQMGTLQMRMLREARAFLDPMVNLGLMEPAQAQAFLMKEVGLSEPMAKQEVDRYSFRAPGQATSYFYGYQRHLALRGKVEMMLGERFDARSYHDFILGQGLLPPALLEQAVLEQYVPARLASR
ncbi:MAG: hypothetical protein QG601_1564 [Pseudomonadota bacterium]|nr:hypothetical protein [Pseudomonadota bacterium]